MDVSDSSSYMSSNSDDFDDSTFILDETDSKSIAPVMYEPEPIPRNDSEHSCSADDSSEEPDDEPGENIHKDHWCLCGNCQIMPTARECVCRCNIIEINDKRLSSTLVKCITSGVCLNVSVLQVAYHIFQIQYGAKAHHGPLHDQLRHIAYRQLTSWCGKKLGKRFRVVLPSCAVTLIRQTFASSGGQYVVFKL